MEASGAQAKHLPARVMLHGVARDVVTEVVASGDRVEFTVPGMPASVSVDRVDLLVAIGAHRGEPPA